MAQSKRDGGGRAGASFSEKLSPKARQRCSTFTSQAHLNVKNKGRGHGYNYSKTAGEGGETEKDNKPKKRLHSHSVTVLDSQMSLFAPVVLFCQNLKNSYKCFLVIYIKKGFRPFNSPPRELF